MEGCPKLSAVIVILLMQTVTLATFRGCKLCWGMGGAGNIADCSTGVGCVKVMVTEKLRKNGAFNCDVIIKFIGNSAESIRLTDRHWKTCYRKCM